MDWQRRSANPSAVATALATSCAIALTALAPGAALAKLKPAGDVRAAGVSVHSVTIAWKDRSRGERGYRVVAGPRGGAELVRYVKHKSSHLRIKGFAPGTVVSFSVSPCRKRRSGCGPAREGKPTATLLAPFNGPHPALQCSVFPAGDPFNERVDGKPIAARSHQIVAAILGGQQIDLHPDFGSNPHYGIPYVVVPHDQPRRAIRFTAYADESDPGPYPIPPGAPIEGGSGSGGDRHVLVVRRPALPAARHLSTSSTDPSAAAAPRTRDGRLGRDLRLPFAITGQRPTAGPRRMPPACPSTPVWSRYDEVQVGVRSTMPSASHRRTRSAYYPPATHSASGSHRRRPAPMGPAPPEGRLLLRAG